VGAGTGSRAPQHGERRDLGAVMPSPMMAMTVTMMMMMLIVTMVTIANSFLNSERKSYPLHH
jgi:hypothetical protein